MDNVLMAQSWQTKQAMKGWGASLLLHACLALAALGFMPKMTLLVQQEPFTWDVALVEAPHEALRHEEPAPTSKVQPAPPVKSRREPARAVEPPPPPVQRQLEARPAPQPVQREVQPVQREAPPVVETVRPPQEIQPPQEVVQVQPKSIEQQEIQKTEPLVQAATPTEVQREVAPAVEQQAVESMPVAAQTYQAEPVVTAPPAVETKPEPVVTASATVMQTAPVDEPAPANQAPAMETTAAVSEPVAAPAPPVPAEPAPAVSAPVMAAEPDPATQQEHQVVASAVAPKRAPKADYKWLADSLHRRIIELRHYPSTARLNGWEGKVVLKVSIRKDGELKDVEVVKSSGHESLDQAAMEAVRRACPLHMKHELTAPMVVLHLPVSYSLNR
ncbi:MAG: putative TonB protein [Nitrospira sp.]|jgi:protein TonB|nr:putative TonB protein [Nitrospira sp.]